MHDYARPSSLSASILPLSSLSHRLPPSPPPSPSSSSSERVPETRRRRRGADINRARGGEREREEEAPRHRGGERGSNVFRAVGGFALERARLAHSWDTAITCEPRRRFFRRCPPPRPPPPPPLPILLFLFLLLPLLLFLVARIRKSHVSDALPARFAVGSTGASAFPSFSHVAPRPAFPPDQSADRSRIGHRRRPPHPRPSKRLVEAATLLDSRIRRENCRAM